MKNTHFELKDNELETVSGGVSWQFFEGKAFIGDVETPQPYIFSDNKTNNFVPI